MNGQIRWYVVRIVAVLAVPCAAALAAGGPAPTVGQHVPVSDPKQLIATIDAIVHLTDEQKISMTEIISEQNKALDDFNTKNAARLQAVHDELVKANESQDQQAIARALEEHQAAYVAQGEIEKKFADRLAKVLTPEQTAKLKDTRLTAMIKGMAAPAELTEPQINAIKIVVNRDPSFGNISAIRDAVNETLTPKQKAAVVKQRAMQLARNRYGKANLTAEQLKQVEAGCDQLVKDETLSFRDVAARLEEKIDALLTPEQKKAMDATTSVTPPRKPAP